MKRNLYLYSGEGTKSSESTFRVLKASARWTESARFLEAELGLDLEETWKSEIGNHRCPTSPLLTVVTQICLSDLWAQWGYAPDVLLGHSVGELSAAYQAGFYSLEEILSLTHRIGTAAARLDGVMLHGKLSERELEALPVTRSSSNFIEDELTHVTLTGYAEEMEAFLRERPDFVRMRIPHPWHHPDYAGYLEPIPELAARPVPQGRFVSGITARFETHLAADHWRRWLTHPVDFVRSFEAIRDRYGDDEIQVIEIGFHPVLDRCCKVFPRYVYASSMFRGEDDVRWIVHQRKRLDPEPFREKLAAAVREFDPALDLGASLAYQGFTSMTFVEFTTCMEPFFPSLSPQDFYTYKTVDQLVDRFGVDRQVDLDLHRYRPSNEVVIAGMSCRFPHAVENGRQFWDVLLSREDQVRGNGGRGDAEAGFLGDETTRFDHGYFGIPQAEAHTMDPQQILALELAEFLWKDAGIDPADLDRSRVGVYIGAWNEEYAGDRQSVFFPTGTNGSIIASRISHHYDLRGPSWVCNTACSSSLVAIHYACMDIRAGRVDYALAGGVNMILGNAYTDIMRRAGFLSPGDRCKAFDNGADGYVRGEGGGLILLANKAVVNAYYAELLGSAVNQNGGRSQIITAPHAEAQEELIREACRDAGIAPEEIAYVECHGTGTKIGDPIEITALQNTVARNRSTDCYLGTVKSNIGHLESAAGIAGLIKAVLILQHGTIPGNLHFHQPNEYIDFDAHRLRVVASDTPLDREEIIGVSSFGFGGTNAHVIVRGAEEAVRKEVADVRVPFDRSRAAPLGDYLQAGRPGEEREETVEAPRAVGTGRAGVEQVVTELFRELTGIEEIDPDIELTEQGLSSLSATELLARLEAMYHVEVDTDVLFEYPLLEQFVEHLTGLVEAHPPT